MLTRALIIAIENYPALADEVAGILEGTLESARAFRQWLIEKKQVPLENLFFCSEPVVANETTHPATREGIKRATIELLKSGSDRTKELYIWFCGHGYAQTSFGGEVTGNALLASDYQDPVETGDCSLKLEGLIDQLRKCMGDGEHFYFIDACRVGRSEDRFGADFPRINYPRSEKEQPKEMVLFSTSLGDEAVVDRRFGQALLDGLGGRGRAKEWFRFGQELPKLVVRFNPLAEFIKERLAPQKPERGGNMNAVGLIMEVPKPWEITCEIEIVGAAPGDSFRLQIYDDTLQELGVPVAFTGPSYVLLLKPKDYHVQISHGEVLSAEPAPVAVGIYDSGKVRFRLIGNPPTAHYIRPSADLICDTHGFGEVAWRSEFELLEPDSREEKSSLEEELKRLFSPVFAAGRPWRAIGLDENGLIQDPALGLSLLGVADIVNPARSSSWKLPTGIPKVSTRSSPKAAPGGCSLHVMVGLKQASTRISVQTGANEEKGAWHTASPMKRCKHIHSYISLAAPGSCLVSIAFDAASVITFATTFLPNRGTLVVVTQDDKGALQIQQMILPIGHLRDSLPGVVRNQLDATLSEYREGESMRFIVDAQKMFRERIGLTALGDDWLQVMLYAKWLDPVMAALACYELLRRGQKEKLVVALGNLDRFFVGLPDVAALRRIAGLQVAAPTGLPIFLGALDAFDAEEAKALLPFPENKLDHGGMWLLWRGVVPPPVPSRPVSGKHKG